MVLLIPFEQLWGAGVTVTVEVGLLVGVDVLVEVAVAGGTATAARRAGWTGCAVVAVPGDTAMNIEAIIAMIATVEKNRGKRLSLLSSS
jgi:galactokinase